MSEFRPTESQRQAIEAPIMDMLVSAAAGSGKTAVLSQRILHLLEQNYDISRMLVVTFTKDAATELKTRISRVLRAKVEALAAKPADERSLEEEKRLSHLSSQLHKTESAEISTIHSFCYTLVRKNFAALGLPAALRVVEEDEMRLLMDRVMEETIDRLYEEDPDFPAFAEHLIAIQDDRLSDVLLDVYTDLVSLPHGIETVKDKAEELAKTSQAFGQSLLLSVICQYFDWFFDYYAKRFPPVMEALLDDPQAVEKYRPALEACMALIQAWQAADKTDYPGLCALFQDHQALAVKTYRGVKSEAASEAYALFKEFRDEVNKIRPYFSLAQEAIAEDCLTASGIARVLYHTLLRFDKAYGDAKRRYGLLDFSDLERLAYRLLYDEKGEVTPLALSERQRYDTLFIDEYQDTNGLQDAIFRAVSDHNRFMVGDIKQSIYSFRAARPELFSQYRMAFPDYREGTGQREARLFLSENFRSDSSVIDFSNRVFAKLFNHNSGKVPYLPEDALKCVRTVDQDAHLPVEFWYIEQKTKYAGTNTVSEAEFVARRAAALVASGVAPENIAILMRTKRAEPLYREALEALSLPCVSESGKSLFDRPEIMLLISLLQVIDNPSRDIPLAAVLKSPLFGFTLSELVEIRHTCPADTLLSSLKAFAEKEVFPPAEKSGEAAGREAPAACETGGAGQVPTEGQEGTEQNRTLSGRCAAFFPFLTQCRRYAEMKSADRVIRYLFSVTPLQAVAVKHTGSDQSLWAFYDFVLAYESSSFHGVHGLVRHIEGMTEDKKISPPAVRPAVDLSAIRLMTIHKSKGCEYDYVILAGTEGKMGGNDSRKELLFDPFLGIGMRLREPSGLVRYDTLLRKAVLMHQAVTALDEEMRILYVALTRAKKQLIITASVKPTKTRTVADQVAARHAAGEHPHPWLFLKNNRYAWWLTASCGAMQPISVWEGEPPLLGLFAQPMSAEATANGSANRPDITRAPDGAPHATSPAGLLSPAVLAERLAFTYPRAEESALPAKLSVSRLYPGILDDEAAELLRSEKADFDTLPLFMQEDLAGRSKYGAVSGAERGTATHLFMQFCDFDRVQRGGIDAEIARLTEEKFITPGIADLIDRKRLSVFFAGDLFHAMTHTAKLYREQRFNVRLPAEELTLQEEKAASLAGAAVLVQGVVDCLLEEADGSLTLVDYKTDHLPNNREEAEAILRERYTRQLTYYRRAVSKVFGRPVKKTLLYSFYLGKTVEIAG